MSAAARPKVSPAALEAARRILDREARRLLAEKQREDDPGTDSESVGTGGNVCGESQRGHGRDKPQSFTDISTVRSCAP
jgi:hypothetical protein